MLADGLVGSVIVAVNVVAFPEINDAGFGVTEMIVESSAFVCNCNDPELPRWVLSPGYMAAIVTACGAFVEGVYNVAQVPPDESVHEVSLNVPPALPSPNDMVPDGVVWKYAVSETDTESVTCPPVFTVVEFDTTAVVVLSNVLVEFVDVPLSAIAGNTRFPVNSKNTVSRIIVVFLFFMNDISRGLC
jgi:hypothetical protein